MKKAIIIFLMLLFTVSLHGVSEASVGTKNYTVNYLDIKLNLNGAEMELLPEREPFIINGTTYLPLRALAELLNYKVAWLGDTKTVVLNSNESAEIIQLRLQLEQMTKENKSLKDQVANLRNEDNEDTDDLKEDLVRDYKKIGEVEIDEIVLHGNEYNLDLTVEVNLEQYQDSWRVLNDSEIQGFIEDILYSIRQDWGVNTRVDGEIIDIDSGRILVSFNKYSDNDTDLSYLDENYREPSPSTNLSVSAVLEELIDDSYSVDELYFSIDDAKYNVANGQVTLKLSAEFGDAQYRWSKLNSVTKKNGVENLFRGILRNFQNSNINVEKMTANFYDDETNLLSAYDYNVARGSLY